MRLQGTCPHPTPLFVKALQYVKSSIHNQRVLLGYKKPAEVRKAQFNDKVYEEDDSDSETIRIINRKPFKQTWQQTMEGRLEKTEKRCKWDQRQCIQNPKYTVKYI